MGEGWQWDFVIVFYDFIFRTFHKWIKSYESGKQRLWISHIFNKNSYSVHCRGWRFERFQILCVCIENNFVWRLFFYLLAVGIWFHRISKYPVAFKLMMMAAHNMRCAHFVGFFLCNFPSYFHLSPRFSFIYCIFCYFALDLSIRLTSARCEYFDIQNPSCSPSTQWLRKHVLHSLVTLFHSYFYFIFALFEHHIVSSCY